MDRRYKTRRRDLFWYLAWYQIDLRAAERLCCFRILVEVSDRAESGGSMLGSELPSGSGLMMDAVMTTGVLKTTRVFWL